MRSAGKIERQRDGAVQLGVVGGQHGFEQRQLQVQARGAVDQGAQILRQAGAAEGEAGLEVGARDVQRVVAAQRVHHFRAVDAQFAGQRADLVGEGDLHGVERVAGVLDHLRGAQRDDGGFHRQAGVDRRHLLHGRGDEPPTTSSDGSMKSRTAAPSRRNSGFETTATSGEPPICRQHDLFAGAGIDGAAHRHDQRLGAAGQRLRRSPGRRGATGRVPGCRSFPKACPRRSGRHRRRPGLRRSETEAVRRPAADAIADQLFQSGFEERRASAEHAIHLELVAVHADHAMTDVRQAGGGDAADVAEAQARQFAGDLQQRKRDPRSLVCHALPIPGSCGAVSMFQ